MSTRAPVVLKAANRSQRERRRQIARSGTHVNYCPSCCLASLNQDSEHIRIWEGTGLLNLYSFRAFELTEDTEDSASLCDPVTCCGLVKTKVRVN
jgi:hypothetical protein